MRSVARFSRPFVQKCIRNVLSVVFLSFALLLGSFPSFAQGSAGRILGTVTDQTGASIAGATVTITDTQRGTSRTLVTDASGAFDAPNLTPSTYTVRRESKGLRRSERRTCCSRRAVK